MAAAGLRRVLGLAVGQARPARARARWYGYEPAPRPPAARRRRRPRYQSRTVARAHDLRRPRACDLLGGVRRPAAAEGRGTHREGRGGRRPPGRWLAGPYGWRVDLAPGLVERLTGGRPVRDIFPVLKPWFARSEYGIKPWEFPLMSPADTHAIAED